jgi:hypothetical protein
MGFKQNGEHQQLGVESLLVGSSHAGRANDLLLPVALHYTPPRDCITPAPFDAMPRTAAGSLLRSCNS